MAPFPIRELGVTALEKIKVLVCGDGGAVRGSDDDIVAPVRQVELENIPKLAFKRRLKLIEIRLYVM